MPDTHDLREEQPKPDTTPGQPSDNEILRARAMGGKINQAELTAKIIARFPKILAELAK
jgi:hypothetical protein